MSLQFRSFLAFIALAAAFVLALTRSTLRDVRPQPAQATEDALVEAANLLAAFLEREADEQGLASADFRETVRAALSRPLQARIYEHTKQAMTLRVYVTDARGIVL